MLYNIKEYTKEFSPKTSASLSVKAQADKDMGLAAIIILCLNTRRYDNLENFIKRNSTYQDFLKNNKFDTVIQHFGKYNKNKITEEDYVRVLNNLRQLTNTKQSNDIENIKTTNIGKNQYVTLEGEDKPRFIDNTRSNKSIQDELNDLQPTQQNFQTTDKKKNTENMFKELEKKKETLNLIYLHEINYELLSNEEKLLFQIASDYQKSIYGIIRIDLKKGIMVDERDNIMKIEKYNGEFSIIREENGVQKEETQQKSYQKTLTPSTNTIYSN